MLITLDRVEIKRLRKERKLSLKDLEKLSGVPDSTLSAIETGTIVNPKLDTAAAIARAFKVPLEKIIKKVS